MYSEIKNLDNETGTFPPKHFQSKLLQLNTPTPTN